MAEPRDKIEGPALLSGFVQNGRADPRLLLQMHTRLVNSGFHCSEPLF